MVPVSSPTVDSLCHFVIGYVSKLVSHVDIINQIQREEGPNKELIARMTIYTGNGVRTPKY